MRLVYSVQASRYGGARPYLRTLGLLLLLRACHENFDPRATVCAEPLATDSIVSVHVKLGSGCPWPNSECPAIYGRPRTHLELKPINHRPRSSRHWAV